MRILVVDDDPFAADMTSAVLEEGGCDAIVVESVAQAQELLEQDVDFDALVSDMNMPVASGLDLFRWVRARGLSMPFILLSGDDADKWLAQEPEINACVVKDENLETTLMTAIADVLLPSAS
jgi:CheY-like chemotaxis protein